MEQNLKPQIRQLNDLDLFRGVCDRDIYPVTTTAAILCRDAKGEAIDGVGDTLEERLQSIEVKLTAIENQINAVLYRLITEEEVKELTEAEQ